ncbi:MAG: SMP-30/gluconolactonase/LRE family protein, partial [Cyclobacteriaceae bacterium]
MYIKLLILFVFTHFSLLQAQNVDIAFTLTEKDLIPEGITYDYTSKSFYIGSIHKNKVVRIDAKGNATDFILTRQDGIGEVLGMHIDNKRRQLWICNNEGENNPGGKSSVYVYDLKSAKLTRKYDWNQENETHLFNDVIVLSSGEGYVTDSDASSIYKVDPIKGTIELF